ncbi:MAG: ANTAR domain-containing protein [Clostridia bacterium]|nr:ANTAR domain-containing protein [Clostridia bacterium]
MDRILIAASGDKGAGYISELLDPSGDVMYDIARSGGEARRMLGADNYDILIVNAPLSDEFGNDLAADTADTYGVGVIILVKAEIADEVADRLEPYGVFVVQKPLSRALFYQALKLLHASRRRILGLKTENLNLQAKMEEVRLISRAKCALIQYLNMTEPQAHRYIEKQAMDMRVTRREIAEGIIKTYET